VHRAGLVTADDMERMRRAVGAGEGQSVVVIAAKFTQIARVFPQLVKETGGLPGVRLVVKPHPAETARLLGIATPDVQADRLGAAAALHQRFGGVVVLKGAGTVVQGAGARPPGICSAGNPGMASGGVGDVLTGVIAALLAQGLAPDDAAEMGVSLHAAAGDLAAGDGERGLLASDLFGPLRRLLNLRS
jgi:NAD(P)H-hydrate epimerase